MHLAVKKLCLFWLLLNSCIVFGGELSDIELGRSIFEDGIGRDKREINATLHGVTLSGSMVACSGCHGKDGRGGGEAFVIAPDIRWLSLSKAFSSRHAGTSRAPYDQTKFAQAVRAGVSSDGRKLDPAMPRIDLADDEVNGLVAYLSIIDQALQTDKSRPSILGLLPFPGKNAYADALHTELKACSAKNVGLPVAPFEMLYFDTPEDAAKKLNFRLQESSNVLILAPFIIGWEKEYANLTQTWNVATILPFSFLDPPDDNEWYFYFPGIESQLIALLESIKRDGYSQLQIVHDPDNILSSRLKNLVLQEAVHFGISTYFDDKKLTKETKSAKLWLVPISKYKISEHNHVDLMLVPVFFYTPEVGKGLANINWRISYPYVPDPHNNGKWRSPVDVWGSAACEFLMRMGDGTFDYNNLSEMGLRWEGSFVLTGKLSFKQRSNAVFISNVSGR